MRLIDFILKCNYLNRKKEKLRGFFYMIDAYVLFYNVNVKFCLNEFCLNFNMFITFFRPYISGLT
jgi:hypothetical protein